MDSYYPAIDGVVLAIDNLANCLSKYNDVTVVVPYTTTINNDINKPYKIIRIKSYHIPLTEYNLAKITTKLSKEYKLLIKENFDIIHIHSPFTVGYLGLKISKKLKIPCISTMHTRFDHEIRRIIKNEYINKKIMKKIINIYNKTDCTITVNKAMIKVLKNFGYKHNPIIINNGTDLLPLNNPEKYISIINNKFNLTNDKNILLFVGRITSIKNIFFILDSLKLLKEDNYPFKMIYVGTGPDESKLKKKIKEYNLQNNIILTGIITNRLLLSSIYKRADLFLFPSLCDTSSLVQIEAAINETPGLFIENSITANTITNNVNGYTCKLDTKIYKDKIKEILDNKKELKKIGIKARKTLAKNWHNIAKETYKLYLKEIDKKNK